jgi:telomerase reverse transcriptase
VPQGVSKSSNSRNMENTVKVMMYIFPRQFGLHNVFTSKVDITQTAQKFQEYTVRENEIMKKFSSPKDKAQGRPKIQIPKRLRGDTKRLVERLQILHGRCAYAELLMHYCPTALDSAAVRKPDTRKSFETNPPETQSLSIQMPKAQHSSHLHAKPKGAKTLRKSQKPIVALPTIDAKTLVELSTSPTQVSSFCQAVLAKIIPVEFWGTEWQGHNKATVMKKVDHFVKMRKYESMSLHEVIQEMKVFWRHA